MKIKAIEPIAVSLPMKKPVQMAGETVTRADNVLVRIESEDGVIGWGEAASAPTMTGDTLAGLTAAVRDHLAPALIGADAWMRPALMRRLRTVLHGNPGAHSAVEMALLDLAGQTAGLPLVDLVGGALRREVKPMWLIGNAAPDEDVAEAQAKARAGIRFFKLMVGFFAAHKDKIVSAQSFLDAAGVKFTLPPDPGGPMYLVSDMGSRLSTAILVYGTLADAGANRYAAEQLQKRYLDRFESAVPIREDFEVTDEELRAHDVIFVGRPESNSALAAWQDKLGLDADGGEFRVVGLAHASETESLAFAATNPLDHRRMVLVLAGNDALETVLLTRAFLGPAQYSVFDSGREIAAGFMK